MRKAKFSLNNFFNSAIAWVYPSKCPVCRHLSEDLPCGRCRQSLIRENLRFDNPIATIDELWSFYPYEGAASSLVKALKYRRETALVKFMANEMSDLYAKWDPEVDIIVPVPIHRTRLSDRGFNQALSLCEKLPQDLMGKNLVRIRKTKPQVQLTPEERSKNLLGAFRCPEEITGKKVLLVDDVFTTGATARECAKALKEAGASWVGVLVFAVRRR